MAEQELHEAVGRLGKRLRRAREVRGLSLANVAATIGCTQQYLSLIEQGERDPDFSLVAKLTVLFDLDLRSIVYGQKVAGALDPEEHDHRDAYPS